MVTDGMSIVRTDLGWEAEEDYLVYDADTLLCQYSNEIECYKTNDGFAICAIVYDVNTGTYHPFLISDVSANAYYTIRRGGYASVYTPNASVTHYKRTWYITSVYGSLSPVLSSNFPYLETELNSVPDTALQILIMAGQRLYRSDKTWAYLAGLAAGITCKSFPMMEV